MAGFTVRKGQRYRAEIKLGFFERVAGNGVIADKLTEAGFVDIQVWGSGGERFAEATWPGDDTEAEMPSQIRNVQAI